MQVAVGFVALALSELATQRHSRLSPHQTATGTFTAGDSLQGTKQLTKDKL